MTTKDDLTKFLQRSRETTDLIARDEYETAVMLALELNDQLEAENKRLKEAITDNGKLKFVHYEAWADSIEKEQKYKSKLTSMLRKIGDALKEVDDAHA